MFFFNQNLFGAVEKSIVAADKLDEAADKSLGAVDKMGEAAE
ncbi:hypothetical protein ACFFJI_01885 [Allobacillus sp. GCM10007491]|nr:hypothetical protein [Allobacillus saliphilus]